MPRLYVLTNPLEATIPLDRPAAVLGRGTDVDVQILHSSVSTHHCRIELSEGQVFVVDLQSTNGTFVDGVPVTRAQLANGQTLRLGSVDLLFDAGAAVEAAGLERTGAAVQAGSNTRTANQSGTGPATSAMCRHHQKLPARYYCPRCAHYFCEACVGARPSTPEKFCRHCGVSCHPVQPDLAPVPEATFFEQVPAAFYYPLRSLGLVHVFIGVVLLTVLGGGIILMGLGSLRLFLGGLLLQIFVGGYFFAFLQNIVHSSIAGDAELPDLPGISNAVDDILLPFGRILVLLLFAFGPAAALVAWGGGVSPAGAAIFAWIALVLGLVYFPMGFLAVAVYDSAGAVNPLLVIPSILKTAVEYGLILVLFGGFFGLRWLGGLVEAVLLPEGLGTKSVGLLFLFVVIRFVSAMTSLYLLLVVMNLLGRLYATNKARLGWLSRD